MLEIGILVFLALAFGYWATLWIMGRRDDVLHGQFVEFEDQGEPAIAMVTAAPQPAAVPTRARRAVAAPKPPMSATSAAGGEALQSLLASIKQELKTAANI
jgi:hypothetical protein